MGGERRQKSWRQRGGARYRRTYSCRDDSEAKTIFHQEQGTVHTRGWSSSRIQRAQRFSQQMPSTAANQLLSAAISKSNRSANDSARIQSWLFLRWKKTRKGKERKKSEFKEEERDWVKGRKEKLVSFFIDSWIKMQKKLRHPFFKLFLQDTAWSFWFCNFSIVIFLIRRSFFLIQIKV